MARKPRIEYPGAVYHVIQRGNNGEYVFRPDRYKAFFLKSLFRVAAGPHLTLLGYVIMDNHYHLLLQTPDQPLNPLMQRINSRFAQHYNWSRSRTGHVFQGRYRALLVLDDPYWLGILRYLHHNPVKAGLCQQVSDYRWSSDVWYRWNRSGVVDLDPILQMLSEDRAQAITMYRQVMAEPNGGKADEYEKGEFIGEEPSRESPVAARADGSSPFRRSREDILRAVCPTETTYRMLLAGSRRRELTDLKLAYIRECLEAGYSKTEIGTLLNRSGSAINQLWRRSGYVSVV